MRQDFDVYLAFGNSSEASAQLEELESRGWDVGEQLSSTGLRRISKWHSDQEALQADLARTIGPIEHVELVGSDQHASDLLKVIFSPSVWVLSIIYFALPACMYGVTLWLPIAIKSLSGLSYFATGVVATIPFILTAIAMVWVGMRSDRADERPWHIAISAFVAAIALAAASHSRLPLLVIGGMTVGMMGAESMTGPFWAMATVQVGANAAAAIAVINSIANLGGYFGPDIIGLLRSGNGQFRGLLAIGITLAISGGLSLFAGAKPKKPAVNAIGGG